ncbi:MAG: ABC transporter substrate-binding protein [Nitrospirae bacterium]|nr:ABC transporter substrate-binding protein [Nitrospirota bacterium]
MSKYDELDELIVDYEKGKMGRRDFMKKAALMGLTLSSVNAFLSSGNKTVQDAFAQTPPAGKPANITVGFFPSWVGGWSGVVVKHRELWKKYLPAGSKLDWDIQVVGPPIVANLIANKSQIGYMGDAPALMATTKRSMADLRIVEVNMFSDTGQICSTMLVRSDAPQFRSVEEAIKWLDGKKIGVSGKGSCGDRFVSSLIRKTNIKPDVQYLDPTIIKTSLQAKKIDAAQSFQPHVSQIVNHGFGRLAFTGSRWSAQDANFILMRKDFIDQYPEAAKGWIKADIEALQFIMKNPYETVKMVSQELPGYTTRDLWMALYGRYPENTGSTETNVIAQVVFDKHVMAFIDENFRFLHSKGAITIDKPLPGGIYTNLVDAAIKEMKIKAPLGPIKGLPLSEFKA